MELIGVGKITLLVKVDFQTVFFCLYCLFNVVDQGVFICGNLVDAHQFVLDEVTMFVRHCLNSSLAAVENGFKPSPHHPHAIEWHVAHVLPAFIRLHFLRRRITRRLIGPFDPLKQDGFAIFRFYGALEVCDLAVRHALAPVLHDA